MSDGTGEHEKDDGGLFDKAEVGMCRSLLDRAILRAIFQSTDVSVFALDRQYRYTAFNDRHAATMKALYGVDIQIGASLADCQSVPGDWQVARKNLDRALRGEAFVVSAYSGDEGRARRFFEISHAPIRADASEIVGVSVYSRDVTERKQAEDELRASEVRFRDMFERSTVGKALTGQDGTLIKVNRAFADMLGYSYETAFASTPITRPTCA